MHAELIGIHQSPFDQFIDPCSYPLYPCFTRVPIYQVHRGTEAEVPRVGYNVHIGVKAVVEKRFIYLAHQRVLFALLVIHWIVQDAVELFSVHIHVFDQFAPRQLPVGDPGIEIGQSYRIAEVRVYPVELVGAVSIGEQVVEGRTILGQPPRTVEVTVPNQIFHLAVLKIVSQKPPLPAIACGSSQIEVSAIGAPRCQTDPGTFILLTFKCIDTFHLTGREVDQPVALAAAAEDTPAVGAEPHNRELDSACVRFIIVGSPITRKITSLLFHHRSQEDIPLFHTGVAVTRFVPSHPYSLISPFDKYLPIETLQVEHGKFVLRSPRAGIDGFEWIVLHIGDKRPVLREPYRSPVALRQQFGDLPPSKIDDGRYRKHCCGVYGVPLQEGFTRIVDDDWTLGYCQEFVSDSLLPSFLSK